MLDPRERKHVRVLAKALREGYGTSERHPETGKLALTEETDAHEQVALPEDGGKAKSSMDQPRRISDILRADESLAVSASSTTSQASAGLLRLMDLAKRG